LFHFLTLGYPSVDGIDFYRRYDVGFVFKFYNLVQNLTALENVELAAQICKDPLDARKVLEAVGLGHRLNNIPSQLSGGEQQRVAIARAIVSKGKPVHHAGQPVGMGMNWHKKNRTTLFSNKSPLLLIRKLGYPILG